MHVRAGMMSSGEFSSEASSALAIPRPEPAHAGVDGQCPKPGLHRHPSWRGGKGKRLSSIAAEGVAGFNGLEDLALNRRHCCQCGPHRGGWIGSCRRTQPLASSFSAHSIAIFISFRKDAASDGVSGAEPDEPAGF